MNAALFRKTALAFLLGAALACSPGKPSVTDEQSRAPAEATDPASTGEGATADEGAGVDPGDVDGSPTSGQCGEDDIACHETMYQLEETLFQYEAAVEKAMDESAQHCWSDDVAAFRRALEDCDDTDCRQAQLRERLASLSGLQPPGQRAAIPLPSQVPLLIAVLGPENEMEADSDAVPFMARGDLVHASTEPEHMGVAVRDGQREHVIVFDMEIGDQPGHDAIMGLVGTSPTTRVLVRGYRLTAPDGVANFDTGRCRQVYQLGR